MTLGFDRLGNVAQLSRQIRAGSHVFSALALAAAQTFSRPYRRFVFCGSPASVGVAEFADNLPITNWRYSRLKVCVTIKADWVPWRSRYLGAMAPRELAGETPVLRHNENGGRLAVSVCVR